MDLQGSVLYSSFQRVLKIFQGALQIFQGIVLCRSPREYSVIRGSIIDLSGSITDSIHYRSPRDYSLEISHELFFIDLPESILDLPGSITDIPGDCSL